MGWRTSNSVSSTQNRLLLLVDIAIQLFWKSLEGKLSSEILVWNKQWPKALGFPFLLPLFPSSFPLFPPLSLFWSFLWGIFCFFWFAECFVVGFKVFLGFGICSAYYISDKTIQVPLYQAEFVKMVSDLLFREKSGMHN